MIFFKGGFYMETNKKFKPNMVQRLLLRKKEVSTERLDALYERIRKDPKCTAEFNMQGKTPARFVSDFIDVATYATDFDFDKIKYIIQHEYTDRYGKKCKLVLEQGYVADYEILYPVTRFTICKDGNVVKKSALGSNFFRGTEIVPMMECARLMHGEDAYAYLMEFMVEKMETLRDCPADIYYEKIHEKNKSKLMRFLRTDKMGRQVIREYKKLMKEKIAYDKYKKTADIANDEQKKEFDSYVVLSDNTQKTVDEKTQKPKEKEERVR